MKRTLAYTIAAGLLIDATVYTASQASRVHDGTQVLAVLLLGAAGLVAVCAAAGAAFGAAWTAVSAAMYARRQQPVKAPEPDVWVPLGYTPSARFDPYWAAVTREVAEAEPGDYRPYTAVHAAPLPPTLPMPVVDLAAWGRHKVGSAR